MDIQYVRFVLALLFVLGLIGLLAFFLRRFDLGGIRISPAFRARARNAEKRLAIVEVATVDARRKLVLVRRDDTEHLVLLGAAGDLLIETNIAPTHDPAGKSPAVGGSFADALRTTGERQR